MRVAALVLGGFLLLAGGVVAVLDHQQRASTVDQLQRSVDELESELSEVRATTLDSAERLTDLRSDVAEQAERLADDEGFLP